MSYAIGGDSDTCPFLLRANGVSPEGCSSYIFTQSFVFAGRSEVIHSRLHNRLLQLLKLMIATWDNNNTKREIKSFIFLPDFNRKKGATSRTGCVDDSPREKISSALLVRDRSKWSRHSTCHRNRID